MEVQNVMCMTGGEGDTSYAKNSGIQEGGISKAKPILQNTIIDLYSKSQSPKCFTIADLGCSSGPNALLVVWEIFEATESICKKLGQDSPELHVFLNDLPGNDWNTLFKSIPSLAEKMGDQFGPYFISARPGSFYGRLFPTDSLNFVHSSNFVRAVTEPMLIDHFGEEIINGLFDRYAVHIGKKLAKGNSRLHSVVMCMTKKE